MWSNIVWSGTLLQWLSADSCPATLNKTFALRPIQLRRKRQLEDWTGPQSDGHSERWLGALTLAWDLNWNDEWRKLPRSISPLKMKKKKKSWKLKFWLPCYFVMLRSSQDILLSSDDAKGGLFGADDATAAEWQHLLEGTSRQGASLSPHSPSAGAVLKGHWVDLISFHFSFLALNNKKGPLNIYLFIHEFRTQVSYLHRG